MIILLSPAKSLNMHIEPTISKQQQPALIEESKRLINQLRGFEKEDLQSLMSISEKIAQLNVERFQNWSLPFSEDNAKPAIFAFQGDVYKGLDAQSLDLDSINFAENSIRILSGLYGILKPLDLIQAYRLEMGTSLENEEGKDLYAFWGNKITQQINHDLAEGEHEWVLNLASVEYFKSVKIRKLNAPVISPIFKDEKNGKYKIISFYAKHARGAMARTVVEKKLSKLHDLRDLRFHGYSFNEELTKNEKEPVFTRSEAALAHFKATN